MRPQHDQCATPGRGDTAHRDALIVRALRFGVGCGLPLICVAAGLVGCGDSSARMDRWFLDSNEAKELAKQAMEAPRPDDRREAIIRLSHSPYAPEPETVRVFGLAATSDRSNAVRTAAVVALGSSATPESCAVCARMLPDPETKLDKLPSEPVRVELLNNLTACAADGNLGDSELPGVRESGAAMLISDGSRNVRLAAARLLGYFPHADSLDALVRALDQRDFGVCHEAGNSLTRLTGQHFDYDPVAWRGYIAQTKDPFATPQAKPAKSKPGIFDWMKPNNADEEAK